MPKVIYEELDYPALSPTTMLVELADSTIRYPEGIAEHVFVRMRDSFVFADFVVMDMEGDLGLDLVLGRPFLRCNTRFIKGHKPINHIRARIKSHVYTIE